MELNYILVTFLVLGRMSLVALESPLEQRGCGKVHPDAIKLDKNDSRTGIGHFPWKVHILVNNTQSIMFDGSLIHPRVILTEANPIIYDADLVSVSNYLPRDSSIYKLLAIEEINKMKPTGVKVRAGYEKTNAMHNAFMQYQNVYKIIVHENFDFALLIVSEAFILSDNINTVCLPNSNYSFDEESCFATGDTQDFIGKVISNNSCQESIRSSDTSEQNYTLPINSICALGENDEYPCEAIKGNPLVCHSSGNSSHYVQVGILSRMFGCKKKNVPDVYGNIASMRVWIDEQMEKQGLSISSYIHRPEEFLKLPSNIHPTEENITDMTPLEIDSPVCGQRYMNRTVKGPPDFEETYFGEFPWMVRILTTKNGEENVYLAGGSLIHPRIVLTGSFILSQKTAMELKVRAGDWDTESTREIWPHYDREVSQIYLHHMSDVTKEKDLALLVVSKPFPITQNINTICLPESINIIKKKHCFLSGWGIHLSGDKDLQSKKMKRLALSIEKEDECKKYMTEGLERNYLLRRGCICTEGKPKQHISEDASGNPLVCSLKENPKRYVQVGIFTKAFDEGEPGIYTDVFAARNWIEEMKKDILSNN